MRLRVAKKICARMVDREGDYSEQQKETAARTYERAKGQREATAFWNDLVGNQMTVADRASILPLGMSFDLLMRHDPRDWNKTANEIKKAGANNGK
jgi:hypothetical protein